jgi:Icc-related predicted phosphoesterase
VIGQDHVDAIVAAGQLDFHMMGDTGGIKNALPQENVAQALEQDLTDKPDGFSPALLYLLGDCVYFNGQPSMYLDQFYDPYLHYTVPIFAVPGNHDGDPIDASQSTLDGFLANFCTSTPVSNPQAGDSGRTTMTQPNVYWTLDAPFVTIIGLYTNVPEHGKLDDTQTMWLIHELTTAPADKSIILTMHHPPLSVDDHHGASKYMMDQLDYAMTTANRVPDLISTGHVHDYQRFTRVLADGEDRDLTYVVAGSGGYHNLHKVAADIKSEPLPADVTALGTGITLDAFDDTHYGYMRVRADATQLTLQAVTASPQPGVAPDQVNPQVVDTVVIPRRNRTWT